jgi:hypothetical protein
MTASARQGFVDSNSREPSRKLCSTFKVGQVLVRSNVRILHNVFRFCIIAQNGPSHAIETLVVAPHQQFV